MKNLADMQQGKMLADVAERQADCRDRIALAPMTTACATLHIHQAKSGRSIHLVGIL
jgi:hypothetical protein